MLFPLYSAGFTATLLHILNGGFNAPDTLFEKHTSFILLAFAFLFPVGVAALWASAAAIWELKDEKSKPHLTSYHSWMGLAVAVLLTLQLIASLLGPMAPWGSGKYSEDDAKMHAQFGGLTYFVGVITCFFGWFSIKDNAAQFLTRNNAIFCVGFFLIMVGMAIATQHSLRLAAERKSKAAAAAANAAKSQ